MEIITLGCCCKKSAKNHENAVIAAKNCGVAEPKNVGDINEILKYGVMGTPAIIIDGKHKGRIEDATLLDICPTITDLIGLRCTRFNEGKSLCINTHK